MKIIVEKMNLVHIITLGFLFEEWKVIVSGLDIMLAYIYANFVEGESK